MFDRKDRHPAFSYARISLALHRKRLNNRLLEVVKAYRKIMRGIIIRSVSPEDAQNVRRLLAVEGYADLGMFEEAAEELRDLDPAWFALERTLSLQLRVFAGLSEPH
jgi:hypothetical protein